MDLEQIGGWSFIAGVAIAVISAFVAVPYAALLLVVLGLIVGFLNVKDKDIGSFLIATIALLVAGLAGQNLSTIPQVGTYLASILNSIQAFVAPAAIVAGLKAVYNIAYRKVI